ncbi:MAG TPA: sulfur carrier protein ThiS [Silvibacterium sp.]|nr:sulfur carrier protein ThiS [Silvibacterium sp.]
MQVVINGRDREFSLASPATVADLVGALELKGDRIALEHNGSIVRRDAWIHTTVCEGDRFEVVHFVGGGTGRP